MIDNDDFGDLIMRADWQDDMLKKIDSRLDCLEKSINIIHTKLEVNIEKVNDHHKSLYGGNGRPGLVETVTTWKGGMLFIAFMLALAQILVGVYF